MIVRAKTNTAAGLFKFGAAEKFANKAADERHAGLAADENHLVEVFGFEFGVSERTKAMRPGASDDVAREVFKLSAGEFAIETEIWPEERKGNLDLHFRR